MECSDISTIIIQFKSDKLINITSQELHLSGNISILYQIIAD